MRPPSLKSGDTIGLIAPSRRVTAEVSERATDVFESWGLHVVKAPGLQSEKHAYHGASIDERAADFQKLLDDSLVKAIVCARGGYGTTQFLDYLNWHKFKLSPKWIVGFSDVTALHLQIHKLGVESLHSLMPLQFNDEKQKPAQDRLRAILFGDVQPLPWKSAVMNRTGECVGQLVGGNLSLITDSLATSNELQTSGQVLFLEEVDEPFYKLDKMMTQLRRAKKLDKIKGLVVGYLTDIKNTDIEYGQRAEEIILSKIPPGVPVAFGCPSGHEAPNMPWIHGAQISLSVNEQRSFIEYC